MKSSLIIMVSLISAACGNINVPVDYQPRTFRFLPAMPDHDSDIDMTVYQFYSDASTLNHKVMADVSDIRLSDSLDGQGQGAVVMPLVVGETVVGLCVTWTAGDKEKWREVLLLRSYWEVATAQTKRSLLYHELGHCELDLPHAPLGSGAIMEPIVLNDEIASAKWFDLVRAEFKSSTIN